MAISTRCEILVSCPMFPLKASVCWLRHAFVPESAEPSPLFNHDVGSIGGGGCGKESSYIGHPIHIVLANYPLGSVDHIAELCN